MPGQSCLTLAGTTTLKPFLERIEVIPMGSSTTIYLSQEVYWVRSLFGVVGLPE